MIALLILKLLVLVEVFGVNGTLRAFMSAISLVIDIVVTLVLMLTPPSRGSYQLYIPLPKPLIASLL